MKKTGISRRQALTAAGGLLAGAAFATRVLAEAPPAEAVTPALIEAAKKEGQVVIYTDSETWAGDIHPVQALRQYREQSGIAANVPRALPDPLLHPGSEDRVRVGRVRPDHQDHIGFVDRLEVLRACRRSKGLAEAVPGRTTRDQHDRRNERRERLSLDPRHHRHGDRLGPGRLL